MVIDLEYLHKIYEEPLLLFYRRTGRTTKFLLELIMSVELDKEIIPVACLTENQKEHNINALKELLRYYDIEYVQPNDRKVLFNDGGLEFVVMKPNYQRGYEYLVDETQFVYDGFLSSKRDDFLVWNKRKINEYYKFNE